jgi:hypothetical protein
MQTETELAEFLALVKNTREHVAYFKELGVEGIENTSLGKSAKAPTSGIQLHPQQHAAPTVYVREAADSSLEVSRQTVLKPPQKPAPPPPDTLFGDLAVPPLKIR